VPDPVSNFSDQAIILKVRPYGEAGAIITVLTENHGKCAGYVNGARTSQRLRAILQSGNIVSLDWWAKSQDQLGRFDIESERDIAASIIGEPHALLSVQSLCGLIDMFLGEREPHPALFRGSLAYLDLLRQTMMWPAAYIMWEMAFLKEMGYGLDLSRCAVTGVTSNLTHISPRTGRAVCAVEAEAYKHKLLRVPAFLRGEGDGGDADIAVGLRMTGYFLVHKLLEQSSFQTIPDARLRLEMVFNPITMAQ